MDDREILDRLHRLEMKVNEQHKQTTRELQNLAGDIDDLEAMLKKLLRAQGL